MTKEDLAVLTVMANTPLRPGDMLLLGPQSVQILSTPDAFKGKLPDKHIIPKHEWCLGGSASGNTGGPEGDVPEPPRGSKGRRAERSANHRSNRR